MRKNKAITLIALVVTIIVLLILAGVTLNMVLGENGIITQAKKAASSTVIASEREYLEQSIVSMQIGQYMDNESSERLGEALKSKNLENSSNWHIIKVDDKSYETGWNYIEKGTKLGDYGEAQDSWLINYETGEMVKLEEDNYLSLSAGDMLAIKDNIIINVDSSIIDKGIKTSTEVEQILGSGVKLHGFENEFTEDSGLTNQSFNFDGKDDWIEVDYNNTEEKNNLIENGFTFEFYGDTTEAKPIKDGIEVDNSKKNGGGFGWWDGNEGHFAKLHFNMLREDKQLTIKWTGATGAKSYPEIEMDSNSVWEVAGTGGRNRMGS